ncbi:hypothetical protein [Celeribacter litoreus]|uniref:hypothetical protein n=1 Tax=Celeribacter litoreus TaxID=2876714 RepID=UPI001CCE1874|nr:hypothetical protein [Celeribacter litoreus]MCA0043910.1 hypothetical protein [Celeribacter litoreus]
MGYDRLITEMKRLPQQSYGLCVGAGLFLGASGAFADVTGPTQVQIDALMDVILFDEVVHVLADEGQSMADDFVAAGYGVPKQAWEVMLTRLYDTDVMTRAFADEMAAALKGCDVEKMLSFYESDLGNRIAHLELETRKTLSSEDAQMAAGDAWASIDPETKRATLIEDYVTVNDLVDMNVVGAMNSDIAYYQGLWSAGFTLDENMSDDDILREIWASEPEVRADVAEWVYGFSTVAYSQLSDEEFENYVEFSRTEAGQELNTALFAAFDAVYEHISRGLGAGTAKVLQQFDGEDL